MEDPFFTDDASAKLSVCRDPVNSREVGMRGTKKIWTTEIKATRIRITMVSCHEYLKFCKEDISRKGLEGCCIRAYSTKPKKNQWGGFDFYRQKHKTQCFLRIAKLKRANNPTVLHYFRMKWTGSTDLVHNSRCLLLLIPETTAQPTIFFRTDKTPRESSQGEKYACRINKYILITGILACLDGADMWAKRSNCLHKNKWRKYTKKIKN